MRVLELSDGEGAAAYAGKLFARWGSEVIKVESPSRPAPERALDLYLNGGKRRVVADFRVPTDRALLDDLAATCDLLVTDAESREVREFDLLGIGGTNGTSHGARVRVSITPFGLTGPYADCPSTPATILALGGYTFFMGDPGQAPLTMPGNYTNYQAGGYAYIAGLAAARRAAQVAGAAPVIIEVSMLECLASLHQMTDTRYIDGGHIRRRHGSSMEVVLNSMLPVKDGYVGLSVNPAFWEPFMLMLGHPEACEPEHPFGTPLGRTQRQEEVDAFLVEAMSEWTAQRIFIEGQETWRVPTGRLSNMAEVLADPHLAARGFFRPIDGAEGVVTPASGFRFMEAPYPVERALVSPGSSSIAEVVRDLKIHPHPNPLPEGEGKRSGAAAHSAPSTEPAGEKRSVQHPALSPARPLDGVRVLDLTRIWSGPVAARILGDLGAQVIKIEEAGNRGPSTVVRGAPGYVASDEGESWEPWNRQSLFNKLQRNREGICVDLKRPAGRDLFLRLVAVSDVVIENFSERAMRQLGLGYDELRAANDRIISLPMPAFGKSGPYKDYIGLGPSIEPLAGLPSLMGYPGGRPISTSKAVPDAIAAIAAASAVVTALERRDRTGLGCQIDLSQHEGAVASIGEFLIERQLSGREPERYGNGHPVHSPYGIYRCAGEDEWIALAARDEAEWAALATFAARGWADDARFATAESRREHRDGLDAAIEEWTCGQDKAALMAELMQRGVPAGAVYSAPEYLADPQLVARGYFADLHHPETGRQRYDGSPLTFYSGGAAAGEGSRGYEQWLPAPKLGEHNWSLLRNLLGMGEAEYAGLVEGRVLRTRPD